MLQDINNKLQIVWLLIKLIVTGKGGFSSVVESSILIISSYINQKGSFRISVFTVKKSKNKNKKPKLSQGISIFELFKSQQIRDTFQCCFLYIHNLNRKGTVCYSMFNIDLHNMIFLTTRIQHILTSSQSTFSFIFSSLLLHLLAFKATACTEQNTMRNVNNLNLLKGIHIQIIAVALSVTFATPF